MIIIRLIFMIIGIFGIVIFFLPTLKKGIFNIGNIVGLILSLIVFGLAVFSWMFSMIFMIVICVLALIILIAVLMLTKAMSKANSRVSEKAEVVFVLGCKVHKDPKDDILLDRIKTAKTYLEKHPNAFCIACGGKDVGNGMSEAEFISYELQKRGINSSRIYLEDKSKSTKENMLYAKEIMNVNKLPNKVAICTNEFHQYRSALYARKVDLRICALPVKTKWYYYPTYHLREMLAIVVAIIKK